MWWENTPHETHRPIYMIPTLVRSTVAYGAEIWGCRKYEEIEKLQAKIHTVDNEIGEINTNILAVK